MQHFPVVHTPIPLVTFAHLAGPASDDLPRIAEWVTTANELHLISGLSGPVLPTSVLEDWVATSLATLAVRHGDDAIAVATLSRSEAELPAGTAEVCHLIVHPRWRRHYRGSHLVLELLSTARRLGFLEVVGRVVSSNTRAHAFLAFLQWKPFDPQVADPSASWARGDFVWYRKRTDGHVR
jgi:ribosomal protein S18 acetylase RimI-like enzyme